MKQRYWRSLSGCKESTTSLTSEHFMNYSHFYKIIVLTSLVAKCRCEFAGSANQNSAAVVRLVATQLILLLACVLSTSSCVASLLISTSKFVTAVCVC